MLDAIWDELQAQIKRLDKGADIAVSRSERAEVVGGIGKSTLAAAPLVAQGATWGLLLIITNARKVGEGPGAGTGTLCYFNEPTNSWYRVGDDTAAAV